MCLHDTKVPKAGVIDSFSAMARGLLHHIHWGGVEWGWWDGCVWSGGGGVGVPRAVSAVFQYTRIGQRKLKDNIVYDM